LDDEADGTPTGVMLPPVTPPDGPPDDCCGGAPVGEDDGDGGGGSVIDTCFVLLGSDAMHLLPSEHVVELELLER
jgi:hypothetical protein